MAEMFDLMRGALDKAHRDMRTPRRWEINEACACQLLLDQRIYSMEGLDLASIFERPLLGIPVSRLPAKPDYANPKTWLGKIVIGKPDYSPDPRWQLIVDEVR
ncbi:hypothetical protein [Novosphingobium sp.]|uniref:hypothetical protein n=1 Tax=Novosphingobium sp. TaxID=1874826 RepID=UPI00286E1A57|nr:hypothetical protein [Novosphingobium sp.]